MKKLQFRDLLSFEARRIISNRSLIVLLIVLLSTFGVIIVKSVNLYREVEAGSTILLETEKKKIKSYIILTQYGDDGITYVFRPSSMSVLFINSSVLPDATINADSAEKHLYYIDIKGKMVFRLMKRYFFDPYGFLLVFIIVSSILYGFFSLSKKGLAFLLISALTPKKYFVYHLLARLLVLLMVILFFLFFCVMVVYIQGINLFTADYLLFVFDILRVAVFFYLVGFVTGLFKKEYRVWGVATAFLVLCLIVPAVIVEFGDTFGNKIESKDALYLKNLDTIMGLEDKLFNKYGKSDSTKQVTDDLKADIRLALSNEFTEILVNETKMKDDIRSNIKIYHLLSTLSPVSFSFATAEELSSKGFKSYIQFYQQSVQLKKVFIQRYAERKFFTNQGRSERGKMKPLIKYGEENVFISQSQLPYYYGLGLLLNLLQIVALIIISFYAFKHRFYKNLLPEHMAAYQPLQFTQKGHVGLKVKNEEDFLEILLSWLFAKNDSQTSAKISFEGRTRTDIAGNFMILPRPSDIFDDVGGDALLELFGVTITTDTNTGKFADLSNMEKALILFRLARDQKKEIYVFVDFWRVADLDDNSPLSKEMIRIITELKQTSLLIHVHSGNMVIPGPDLRLKPMENSKPHTP